jgi:hypothetical protein
MTSETVDTILALTVLALLLVAAVVGHAHISAQLY